MPVERAEEHFGMEIRDQETADRLQLLASDAPARVQQWVDEGMPVDVMGDPQAIQDFRERQAARPPAVPTNIERQNARSVQRSSEAAAETGSVGSTQVPETVRDVISSPGQSLDASIQRAMEERMGDTFGDVRIHTGVRAAAACDAIDARAFTVGNHVAFNTGEFDPSSPEGQHLLAHELAHVRQRTDGAVSTLSSETGAMGVAPTTSQRRAPEETSSLSASRSRTDAGGVDGRIVPVQRAQDDRRGADYQETDGGKVDRSQVQVEYRETLDVEPTFTRPQLHGKFKHAEDFGVVGTWNDQSAEAFERAILEHIEHPNSVVIRGTYHDQPAVHVFDLETKNNVFLHPDGEFWTCWNLSDPQERHLLTTGDL